MGSNAVVTQPQIAQDVIALKAFADPTRLRLLFLLAERELCVCELVAVLDESQGKVSRHLAHLRHAGLVTDRREGTWVHYSLAPAKTPLVRSLIEYVTEHRATMPSAIKDLARLHDLGESATLCVPDPVRQSADRPPRNRRMPNP